LTRPLEQRDLRMWLGRAKP